MASCTRAEISGTKSKRRHPPSLQVFCNKEGPLHIGASNVLWIHQSCCVLFWKRYWRNSNVFIFFQAIASVTLHHVAVKKSLENASNVLQVWLWPFHVLQNLTVADCFGSHFWWRVWHYQICYHAQQSRRIFSWHRWFIIAKRRKTARSTSPLICCSQYQSLPIKDWTQVSKTGFNDDTYGFLQSVGSLLSSNSVFHGGKLRSLVNVVSLLSRLL